MQEHKHTWEDMFQSVVNSCRFVRHEFFTWPMQTVLRHPFSKSQKCNAYVLRVFTFAQEMCYGCISHCTWNHDLEQGQVIHCCFEHGVNEHCRAVPENYNDSNRDIRDREQKGKGTRAMQVLWIM